MDSRVDCRLIKSVWALCPSLPTGLLSSLPLQQRGTGCFFPLVVDMYDGKGVCFSLRNLDSFLLRWNSMVRGIETHLGRLLCVSKGPINIVHWRRY